MFARALLRTRDDDDDDDGRVVVVAISDMESWIFETEYRASQVLVRRFRTALKSFCAVSCLFASSPSASAFVGVL